jgi:hypothetical protein
MQGMEGEEVGTCLIRDVICNVQWIVMRVSQYVVI